jgi:CRP/FNR family transcriptional regulator, cyclic AMP receptor protein
MSERDELLDRILAADRAVRLLDEDPELFAGVPSHAVPQLRSGAVVPLLRLERGGWDGRPSCDPDSCLGLIVLDGLLLHSVGVGAQPRSVLIGPGDLIRPWEQDEDTASVPFSSQWDVLHPARLAVLDARFMRLVARFPQIVQAIVARTTRRARWLALQLAVSDVRRVDDRLMLFFWHLADRWGRVRPDGVLVPLPVTHDVLAQLVCAQRPTVTSALRRLSDAGRIRRRRDRSWILEPDAPQAVTPHPETTEPAVFG